MKTNCYGVIFFLLFLFGFVSPDLKSQVTIGLNEEPQSGSLLQLKNLSNITDGGANATKGLMLPRVSLTDMNSLKDISGFTAGEEALYTGLTVFNLDRCLDYGFTDSKGVYIWNGANWNKVGGRSQSASVSEYVDLRDPSNPQTYLYRTFGDAGTWMLENMRATTYQQGSVGGDLTLGLVAGSNVDYYVKKYAYPTIDAAGDGTDRSLLDKLPAIGLLYNWAATTNNENIPENNSLPVNQGQLTPGSTIGNNEVENAVAPGGGKGKIQGICPNGWHVPSDREWNELERELTLHASKYSTNADAAWDEQWETAISGRGPVGETLKTSCLPPGMNSSASVGKSFPASQGGFCLYLTGYYHSINKRFQDYGDRAFYRTSSSGKDDTNYKTAFHRSLRGTDISSIRTDGPRNNMMPVRCKRDY